MAVVADVVGVWSFGGDLAALGPLPPRETDAESAEDAGTWGPLLFPLLLRLARGQASGRLTLLAGESTVIDGGMRSGKVTVWKERGKGNNDALYAVLRERRPISEALLDRAMSEANEKQVGLGRLLVENQWLQGPDLVRAILEAKLRLLARALESDGGAYRFEVLAVAAAPDDPVSLPLDGLLCLWLRRLLGRYYEADIYSRLEGMNHLYPLADSEAPAFMQKWGWPEREVAALRSTFHGKLPLGSALRGTSLSRAAAARVAAAALALGRMALRDEPEGAERALDEMERLQVDVAELGRLDLFERLGAHWTAHPDDLREAYRRARQRFLQTIAEDPQAEPICRAGLVLLDEAREGLSLPDRRVAYRLTRYGETEIRRATSLLTGQAAQHRIRGELQQALRLLDCVRDMGFATAEALELYDQCQSELRS